MSSSKNKLQVYACLHNTISSSLICKATYEPQMQNINIYTSYIHLFQVFIVLKMLIYSTTEIKQKITNSNTTHASNCFIFSISLTFYNANW